MPPVRFFLFWCVLPACGFVSQAPGEYIPSGTYHEQGRIVAKADGQLAVFRGSNTYLFPKPLQEALRPYLNDFVDVEYTRVATVRGESSFGDGKIGAITRVDFKVEDATHLPIVCKLKPSKTVYDLGEPVVLHTSVTNRTDKPQELDLGTGGTVALCQDYEQWLALDWLEEYYSQDAPWGLPVGFGQYRTLAAGETLEYDVSSAFMVRPGTYQAVLYLPRVPAKGCDIQSEPGMITVAPARDREEEHVALQSWLRAAAYPQRVEIAERLLLRFQDASGTAEILRLLGKGIYSRESHWEPPAFRYAWKHGGKDGERTMLDLIEGQERQAVVEHLLEDIGWSPNRIALLRELLACENAVFKDDDSWVTTPRICDLTAVFLRGEQSDPKAKFPNFGSVEERDRAVGEVVETLRSKPGSLHIPAETYSEDKTLAEGRKAASRPD